MTISYQKHCEEYALFGDPAREHWEHEEAARYDQWDGHRMDFPLDPDDEPEMHPDDAWLTVLWEEGRIEETVDRAWADHVAAPVPF